MRCLLGSLVLGCLLQAGLAPCPQGQCVASCRTPEQPQLCPQLFPRPDASRTFPLLWLLLVSQSQSKLPVESGGRHGAQTAFLNSDRLLGSGRCGFSTGASLGVLSELGQSNKGFLVPVLNLPVPLNPRVSTHVLLGPALDRGGF